MLEIFWTFRYPPSFGSYTENHTISGPCTKQNGCHDSGTSPAVRIKSSFPLDRASAYNISSFSQKSDFSGRTHPMFLSHLEPAMNPTNSFLNVTESNAQGADSTDRQAGLGRKHQPMTSGPSLLQLGMAIGISVGVMLLFLILAYATYKYRSRDEGTYRIDEGNGYGYDAYNSKPLIHLNGRARYSRQKSKDNKEWYVWWLIVVYCTDRYFVYIYIYRQWHTRHLEVFATYNLL